MCDKGACKICGRFGHAEVFCYEMIRYLPVGEPAIVNGNVEEDTAVASQAMGQDTGQLGVGSSAKWHSLLSKLRP